MMSPYIFFPFSHISQDQLAALQIFFPAFTFFPVDCDFEGHEQLQKMVDTGAATPVFSSKKDLSSVHHTFEQYMTWVKIHKGNENNLRFLLKNNPYFTSDSDLTAIKSQIRNADKKQMEPIKPEKDVLLHDLLFLKMAKQCDEENESVDLKLRIIDKNRGRMLLALLGDEDLTDASEGGGERDIPDPGDMMTRERIEAWSRCMIQSGIFQTIEQSPVFVTTSTAVFDYLETICSDVINALDIDPIKVHENDCENKTGWQQEVVKQIMCAAKGNTGRQNHLPEANDECSLFGQIKLSFFSGNNSHPLFNLKDKQVPVCLIRLK